MEVSIKTCFGLFDCSRNIKYISKVGPRPNRPSSEKEAHIYIYICPDALSQVLTTCTGSTGGQVLQVVRPCRRKPLLVVATPWRVFVVDVFRDVFCWHYLPDTPCMPYMIIYAYIDPSNHRSPLLSSSMVQSVQLGT